MEEKSDQSAAFYSNMSKNDKKTIRLPDFLGIGTQKGGTTTLHDLLRKDKRIGLPRKKEVHYFDQEDQLPVKWYADQFINLSNKQVIGEITPYYMHHPLAPNRIKKIIPDVKLIALLRDPVDRAISQYFHSQRNGFEHLSLFNAIEMEDERMATGGRYSHQKHSYITRSRYEEQLNRYLKIFKPNKLLIIKSEDLFKRPSQSWVTIQMFLGLDPQEMKEEMPKANQGRKEAKLVSEETRAQIRAKLVNTYNILLNRYNINWD